MDGVVLFFSRIWYLYVRMEVSWYAAYFSTVLGLVTSTHWCCVTHVPGFLMADFVSGLYILAVGFWWTMGWVGAGIHRMVLWVLLPIGVAVVERLTGCPGQ